MGTLPCGFPGAATAARLLTRSRRESTWLSYSGKLKRWIDYCTVVVPSRGFPAISPFPAQRQHVLAYLGYLRDEHRVKSGSLQQYLSAINSWHADMGLEKPAVGHVIQLLRRGFGEEQAEDDEEEVVARRPIPAPVMARILHLAQSAPSMLLRRAATASVLAYAFLLRADSLVRMLHRHVSFDVDCMSIKIQTKSKRRDRAVTVRRPGQDEVYFLMRKWCSDLRGAPDSSLWSLGGDAEERFPSPCLGKWFEDCCKHLGLQPPVGEKWCGHSHRSGGATGASAVDASLPAIARFGVWDHLDSVQPYIDPTVAPTPAALLFFDHLLKPSVTAVRAILEQQRQRSGVTL